MQEATKTRSRWLALSLIVALTILVADLVLPLGVAAGLPYVVLVLIGLWAPWSNSIYIFAAVGTVLILLGYYLSPGGGVAWVVLANRVLALFTIWITATLATRTLRDKERHRKMEEALRRSEHELSLIVDNVPALISHVDASQRFKFVNKAHETLFGRPQSEIVGTHMKGFLGESNYDSHRSAIDAALSGKPTVIEGRICMDDASDRWVMGHYVPDFDSQDQVRGFFALTVDITKLKETEQALRIAHDDLQRSNVELQSSESKFRALLETTQDGVVISDRRGRIVLVNALAETMFGYARDELLGTPAVMLVPEEHRERHSTRLAASVKDPKARLMDSGLNLLGRRKDGTSFPVSISLNPARGNRELLIVAVVRDVGDQRRAERQLQWAQKMDVVGKLAVGIAHDFNNILTVIRGYSTLITDQLFDGRLRHNAEAITKATDRAGLLTRHLLAFSRREQTNVQVIDLHRFLNEIDSVLRRTIGEDINLRMTFAPGGSRIEIDPAQMEQVILNLAVNARDAMPSGGYLTIETANIHIAAPHSDGDVQLEPGGYALLTVSDTGDGMDRETLAHIFDPFFTTKEHGKGTGLGLSAVYDIVKQSGGTISVHSTPGAGAAFEIYLPRVDQPEPVPGHPDKVRQKPLPGRHKILLVEDDEDLRTLTSQVLQSNGYLVLTAANPVEAMKLIRGCHSIDLLLTDLVMPRMSGVELADRLTSSQPRLKVLFMSGYTDSKIRQVQRPESGTAILKKPFSPEALLTKVAETVKRPQTDFHDRGHPAPGKAKSVSSAGRKS